ncbi:AraC family transcriptional regulator [Sinisalibacter aestuarii]|nr:AraC family transcriptional regulator [Sinisalibacter aestuarii]
MESLRLSDREDGYFGVDGGPVGSGNISASKIVASNCLLKLPESGVIRYEKATFGDVGADIADDCVEITSTDALIVGDCGVELKVRPGKQVVRGFATTLTLDLLDAYIRQGRLRRTGAIRTTAIRNSGPHGVDGELISLTTHAVDHIDSFGNGRSGLLMEALLLETFVNLLIAIGALELRNGITTAAASVARRAQDYIHEFYADPLTVTDIAQATGVGVRQLQLSFKQCLATTPREYLCGVRLDAARQMLLNHPALNVTEVAGECGISHMGRFAKEYRRRFGEVPSETLMRSRAH